MATAVLKPAQTQKTCDMCGEPKAHYFRGVEGIDMGWICAQSDRWKKTITIKVSASIPYHPSDDICTNCARNAMERIIKKIEGESDEQ